MDNLNLAEIKVFGFPVTNTNTAVALSNSQTTSAIASNENKLATQTSDRTLSFLYGPEHQRINQVIELTNNAPTQYQAGTIWYLNGDDGQSLTYEKEIKTSGVIEHKHYLTAAGMTFALYTQRAGTGVTANGTAPIAATPVLYCPSGQTLVGGNCTNTAAVGISSLTRYSCPAGQTLVGPSARPPMQPKT